MSSQNKWVLVQTKDGKRNMVNVRSLMQPTDDWKCTTENADASPGDYPKPGNSQVHEESRLRNLLEQPRKQESKDTEAAGPSVKTEDQVEDYSSSGSSWAPEEASASAESDDSQIEEKKVKLHQNFKGRQYINNRRSSKKVQMPTHRPEPVIPNTTKSKVLNNITNNRNINSKNNSKTIILNKSLPDSTRKKPREPTKDQISTIPQEIKDMKKCFSDLFNMLKVLKLKYNCVQENNNKMDISPVKEEQSPNVIHENIRSGTEENDENISDGEDRGNQSDESNRSEDNVLITNKYDNITIKKPPPNADKKDWIPIGSGKTLLHIDKYRTVNWRSYTIATRTLLLALFSKRILATHSLTGKRSPAFQNKPAKMCLDPKTISDVIIEVTERFNVKENLVRSIITTKCADECKMYRMRKKKKSIRKRNKELMVVKCKGDDSQKTS